MSVRIIQSNWFVLTYICIIYYLYTYTNYEHKQIILVILFHVASEHLRLTHWRPYSCENSLEHYTRMRDKIQTTCFLFNFKVRALLLKSPPPLVEHTVHVHSMANICFRISLCLFQTAIQLIFVVTSWIAGKLEIHNTWFHTTQSPS